MLVLLGVGSVEPDPRTSSLVLLLAIALCFHTFAYVFNDVIDLPTDRTHPARQNDFLVRGTISKNQALAISLAQIPLAVGLAWWAEAGWPAILCLLLGFGLMAVYDIWGKRCPIPPLTDLAQGLGWGSLALFAALALGHRPNLLTWVATFHGIWFIFLINGVHGGLRDLENDLARSRITTASFFGAQPGQPVRGALWPFAVAIQLAMIAVNLLPLLTGSLNLTRVGVVLVSLAMGGLSLACLIYMVRVLDVKNRSWAQNFRIHLALLQLPPALIFSAYMDLRLTLVMFATMIGAYLFLDVFWEIARGLPRSLRYRINVNVTDF